MTDIKELEAAIQIWTARLDTAHARIEQLEAQLNDNSERYGNAIAARIEQLEAALREIKDQLLTSDQASAIARAALTPKREENDDVFKGFRGNNDSA